jgi:hypothetical protein
VICEKRRGGRSTTTQGVAIDACREYELKRSETHVFTEEVKSRQEIARRLL